MQCMSDINEEDLVLEEHATFEIFLGRDGGKLHIVIGCGLGNSQWRYRGSFLRCH